MTGTLSVAERSYPTSEVRGRSRKDPMPEGRRPRGVTPRPRSGQQPKVPGWEGPGTAKRSYPSKKSYPASEVKGDSREELPRVRGAVAEWVQEALEELSHFEGQEGPR